VPINSKESLSAYLAHKNLAAKISSFSSATGGESEWNWMTKENNQ